MRVTPQAKAQTEQAILEHARRLFTRKGLEATSTREIATAAGIAVGTLFNYHASKEALALAIAADAFAAGREEAQRRLEACGPNSLEADLFTLIACDLRALQGIRPFVGELLDAGLAPFVGGSPTADASPIRAHRLADAHAVLTRHGAGLGGTPALMHLYWSLYLGVLSFWAGDPSPNQEDTLALLDRSVRMFAGAVRPAPGASGAAGA
mgnify:CR=1 FL=1